MSTPGAVMSGLLRSASGAGVGPRKLKSASTSPWRVPLVIGATSAVVLDGLAATNAITASPDAWSMLNAGTLGAPVVSMFSEPAWLLPMMTMSAPALNALVIFSVNGQVPRRTTATAPVKVPAGMPPDAVQPSMLVG